MGCFNANSCIGYCAFVQSAMPGCTGVSRVCLLLVKGILSHVAVCKLDV